MSVLYLASGDLVGDERATCPRARKQCSGPQVNLVSDLLAEVFVRADIIINC